MYESLKSTSDKAKELAVTGASHGTVIVAATQTGGRGRKDHSFFSPEGGLYMSIVLKPRSFFSTDSKEVNSFVGNAVISAKDIMSSADVAKTRDNTKVLDLVYISIGAALIAICSWISIPTAVPFTLQTFAVFFVLLSLGGERGTLATLVYVLLGAVGVPVFAGFSGGIGILLGSTGGYIIGFLFTGTYIHSFH